MMKKFLQIFTTILLVLVTANTAFASQMILFVLDGCSHCANVEKYMEENSTASKLNVKVYELSTDLEAQSLYEQKSAEVGYTGGKVPLLIDGVTYFVGDTDIINYFKKESEVSGTNEVTVKTQSVEPASSATETSKAEPETLTSDAQNQLKNILAENLPPPSWFNKNKTYIGIGILLIIVGVMAKLLARIKKL